MTFSTDHLSAIDRLEIEDLTCSYGMHHDRRDFASLRACFTDRATYVMRVAGGTTYGPHEGADAIVAQIRSFKAQQSDIRRHHITNVRIEPIDADHAIVRSYVIVSAVEGGTATVKTVGTYTDAVVRTSDGWLIAEKSLELETTF
ncbi:hypothetical protein GCM10009819_07590 [Agromyces tropicus]|uniref:SnoaL-like domain-containing protein n=1 Tax=Agromyces tropicus TaxID=555371 RepID=A0ABN2U3A4_9MICO